MRPRVAPPLRNASSAACRRRAARLSPLTFAYPRDGAVAPPVDVTEVDALEREPGQAAKLKLVKSTVLSRHAVPAG